MARVIENIVYQHAENATFLWMLRMNAVDQSHYNFKDLIELDGRVEANIDGLRVAGNSAFEHLLELRKADDAGAIFATAVLATEQGNTDILQGLYAELDRCPDKIHELIGAFSWVDAKYLGGIVKSLLQSESDTLRCVGFAVCTIHGRDPGELLEKSILGLPAGLTQSASAVEALRCAGGIARVDLLQHIKTQEVHDSDFVAFNRMRSSLLLGERHASISGLEILALSESGYATHATELLMLAAPASAKDVLRDIATSGTRMRDVVRGFGLLGDPVALPWLLEKTGVAEYSRLAGESISMITGVDIAYLDLDAADVRDNSAGPNDDPADPSVELEVDEDLPWPSQKKLALWWGTESSKYPKGNRFLAGQPKTVDGFSHILKYGRQRQRHCAATGLALLCPKQRLVDTRAPSLLQQGWFSQWSC